MAVGKWFADVQYLLAKEDSALLNVVDDSVLAQLLSIGSSAGSFDDATDSLEAISNAISSSTAGSNVPTADSADNILSRDVVGNKSDTIDGTSVVAKLKHLLTSHLNRGTSPNTGGTANTSTRIELASTASSVDGAYDPAVVLIVSGTGAGQARQIWEYDGTNRYAYVNRDWKVIPDDTSVYGIIADAGDTHVNEGVAQGGTNNTITLNALASAQNSLYLGQIIFVVAGTGADQSRMVVGYSGATKVATVDSNWIVNPDATSVYAMFPYPGFVHGVPTADASANILSRDVIGNKSDATAAGAVTTDESLMAYTKQIVGFTESGGSTLNVPQFAGNIAYVDADATDDTASGLTPSAPKKTIAAAQVVAGIGGAVAIKAGTYAENVVMSYSSQELWPAIGTILDGDGTCLTISGGYCHVKGYLEITPAADQIGVAITTLGGNVLDNIRVVGAASTCGYDIDTAKNILNRCKCTGIKATGKAYDIGASRNVLNDCSTVGTTTSYGYYIDGTALKGGKLVNCTSTGNQTSGFYLDEISGMSIIGCSSGSGDGKWRDIDSANVWGKDFSYDNVIHKTIDFTDASTTFNLFKVTGTVKLEGIEGIVEEVLNSEMGNCKLRVVAGVNTTDLTDTVSLNGLAARSYIGKTAGVATAMSVGSSASPQVLENANYRDPAVISIIVAEEGTNTFIQLLSDDSAGNKDGKIHWHGNWEPISHDGMVVAA